MGQVRQLPFICCVALICSLLARESAVAQGGPNVNKGADNLMAVQRELMGANKKDEALQPVGKVKTKLPDGKEVEFEMASFEFLGDMHIRFVFDGPQVMLNATPQDLSRLNLSPNAALQLAVAKAGLWKSND